MVFQYWFLHEQVLYVPPGARLTMALAPGGGKFGDAGINVLSCNLFLWPVSAVGSGSNTTLKYHSGMTVFLGESRLLKVLEVK